MYSCRVISIGLFLFAHKEDQNYTKQRKRNRKIGKDEDIESRQEIRAAKTRG